MKQFPSIEKLDTGILYTLELPSSLSVLLLAFGLIASMANVLTNEAAGVVWYSYAFTLATFDETRSLDVFLDHLGEKQVSTRTIRNNVGQSN